jgi:hypothetical protein
LAYLVVKNTETAKVAESNRKDRKERLGVLGGKKH